MKILIVDDLSTMRSLIRGMLANMGFKKLHEASNGEEALSLMKNEGFDLIISDLHMPHMDGLGLLGETRKSDTLRNTKFLMITTETSKDAVLKAIKLKVNGYIVKPFTSDTLYKKLAMLHIKPD